MEIFPKFSYFANQHPRCLYYLQFLGQFVDFLQKLALVRGNPPQRYAVVTFYLWIIIQDSRELKPGIVPSVFDLPDNLKATKERKPRKRKHENDSSYSAADNSQSSAFVSKEK